MGYRLTHRKQGGHALPSYAALFLSATTAFIVHEAEMLPLPPAASESSLCGSCGISVKAAGGKRYKEPVNSLSTNLIIVSGN